MKRIQKLKNKAKLKAKSNSKYPLGGRFGDLIGDISDMNWKDAGDLATNFTKAVGDTALSSVGLNNVITEEDYTGQGKGLNKAADVAGKVGKMALPLALQTVGVPMIATRAAQAGLNQFNPDEPQIMPDGGKFQTAVTGGFDAKRMVKKRVPSNRKSNIILNSFAPDVELENKEVFRTPEGIVDQVNGPSHEQGGVPVRIPNGTDIWSDRLKMNGKTFAKLAAKYKTKKEEEILGSDSSSKAAKTSAELNLMTKNTKLDELFNQQESLKAKKINNYIKKYGGKMQYPNGGTFDDPERLPETQEEIEMQMRDNLIRQGFNLPDELNPQLPPFDVSLTNPQGIAPNQVVSTPEININQEIQPLQTGKQSILDKGIIGARKLGNTLNENKEDILREGAVGVLNNIGNLAYLAEQGKRYDQVDYGSVTPTLLSDRESLNQIKEGYNTGQYNLRNSGRVTQSGAIALANERMKQGAAAKERIANVNAGINNQFAQYNKGLQMQSMQDTAANKGQSQTNYYTALGATGQNVMLQRRDYLQRAMDQKKLNLIKDYFPDYTLDPSTLTYYYNLAKKQQENGR